MAEHKVYRYLLEYMMNPELDIVDDLALDIKNWLKIVDDMYSGKQETWCTGVCQDDDYWYCHICKMIKESRT